MNVIVANSQRDVLSNLDVDIIKSMFGEYEANEIVEMFKNFFYNRMILDVTAIKNFENIESFKTIAKDLDVDKIIFFLPKGSSVCTSNFISDLVSTGIYNFTTNVDGIKYLLDKPNTLKEVAHLQKNGSVSVSNSNSGNLSRVIGFRSVTRGAGATTLIVMLKKELNSRVRERVVAIESGKDDFSYFNDKSLISVPDEKLVETINKNSTNSIVLVDLNKNKNDSICQEVIYLIEPSIIGLNRLVSKNKTIFSKLSGKKVVLNKSLLNNKDVSDFEYESKSKIFYNIPPLNDRESNPGLVNFLGKLGLVQVQNNDSGSVNNNKLFGLFKR